MFIKAQSLVKNETQEDIKSATWMYNFIAAYSAVTHAHIQVCPNGVVDLTEMCSVKV